MQVLALAEPLDLIEAKGFTWCRNEVSKSLRATSPLLAVILALLVAFNLSALVLFVVHMHVFCGHRTCFGAGTGMQPTVSD